MNIIIASLEYSRNSFRKKVFFLIMLFILAIFSNSALAHKASDSYLRANIESHQIILQWDIALRDLEEAVGLDEDGNGDITWRELKASQNAINAYALPRLSVQCNGQATSSSEKSELFVDNHSDGAYAVLKFSLTCPQAIQSVNFFYQLLFDIDSQHRGILNVTNENEQYSTILSPDNPTYKFNIAETQPSSFVTYIEEGIYHILIGYDHILFLLTLLIASVLHRKFGNWVPLEYLSPAVIDVLKIVTSFTLAHSLTLTLAALNIINLPEKFIEIVIALSIAVVAVHNFYPFGISRRWILAFFFGLIHGFGFANVLGDAGLSGQQFAFSLIGFNIGVEIGQLAIVALFVPIAYYIRKTWFYQQLIFKGGSLLVIAIALFWAFQRSV